jgi:16S rRNA (uracil1498-N3)-methyltransferase
MTGLRFCSEVEVRAVYLEGIQVDEGKKIVLDGDVHKHLAKVVRVKKTEKIKILNGEGVSALAVIESVDKKETCLSIESVSKSPDSRKFHLIVGLTKKEALEEVLRKSVELGVSSLRFVESEYSQKSFLKPDRISNILESAYCQSNNPWKLDNIELIKFAQLEQMIKEHSSAFLMTLVDSNLTHTVTVDSLLLIGPEGGFSAQEEALLTSWGVDALKLEIPIMRAPTAAVCGIGFLHCALRG